MSTDPQAELIASAADQDVVADNDASPPAVRHMHPQEDHAQQAEMPFAIVQGEAITEVPKDLYIPPDALEVFLEAFEGPLDLLLYLIKRQNLDILDIPITDITRQYMRYIDLMDNMKLELAGEYLVMAAMLAEIKSRMLLPRPVNDEGEEEDPRAALIRRLQEYERFKKAAEDIDSLQRVGREVFLIGTELAERKVLKLQPDVELDDLLLAFRDVMSRSDMFISHQVERETLSVRERMSEVLSRLNAETFTPFVSLFDAKEGRPGAVVTFLAILELLKETLIDMVQAEPYAPIHVKAVSD